MAMQIQSEVFREGQPYFNWTQYKTQYPIHQTDEAISNGLAQRLARYAAGILEEAGFGAVVQGWACTVITLDGNERPADREYHVRFLNSKGGFMEVNRIHTRKGWPFLDFGISAGQD